MLGRSSAPRETVVVQQPERRASDSGNASVYRHAPDDDATPDAEVAASDVQHAQAAKPPAKERKNVWLGAVVVLGGLFLAVWLVVALFRRARRAWLERKARYMSHTNYRL
ncbi:hypothetical protein P350_35860 [Burkholderia cepacia JBK9]|uniref:hypothetical protein n=1 Tax=Burkholderia arboris TaxID=488730 RepID=UPI0004D962EC|nr:hypothetical protein [Burkholderia arboris]ALX16996.1 hypothetical protein P350_35860 [Burkholderia cepacia JBK9]MCA8493630.1 hypothetical protein [Burkholderia arboris]UTV59924.1 hypothetical protein NLX30_37710 [Burkholderia arboris]